MASMLDSAAKAMSDVVSGVSDLVSGQRAEPPEKLDVSYIHDRIIGRLTSRLGYQTGFRRR
jgi:hypothetical protein